MYVCVTGGCPDNGETEMKCKIGFEPDSPLCAICSPGYRLVGGDCKECEEPRWGLLMLLLFLFVGACMSASRRVSVVVTCLFHHTHTHKHTLPHSPTHTLTHSHTHPHSPTHTHTLSIDLTGLVSYATYLATKHHALLTHASVFAHFKILVSFVTLVITCDTSFGVVWPTSFLSILRGLSVLSMDISAVSSMFCLSDISYYHSLVISVVCLLSVEVFVLFVMPFIHIGYSQRHSLYDGMG
jgi:hypothetical protein